MNGMILYPTDDELAEIKLAMYIKLWDQFQEAPPIVKKHLDMRIVFALNIIVTAIRDTQRFLTKETVLG